MASLKMKMDVASVKYGASSERLAQLQEIVDENKNGQWDTGRFLDRSAPEKVYHHEPLLDVRANWELQERFILE